MSTNVVYGRNGLGAGELIKIFSEQAAQPGGGVQKFSMQGRIQGGGGKGAVPWLEFGASKTIFSFLIRI